MEVREVEQNVKPQSKERQPGRIQTSLGTASLTADTSQLDPAPLRPEQLFSNHKEVPLDVFLKVVKHKQPKEKDAQFYSLLLAQNNQKEEYKDIFSKQVSQLKSVKPKPPICKPASLERDPAKPEGEEIKDGEKSMEDRPKKEVSRVVNGVNFDFRFEEEPPVEVKEVPRPRPETNLTQKFKDRGQVIKVSRTKILDGRSQVQYTLRKRKAQIRRQRDEELSRKSFHLEPGNQLQGKTSIAIPAASEGHASILRPDLDQAVQPIPSSYTRNPRQMYHQSEQRHPQRSSMPPAMPSPPPQKAAKRLGLADRHVQHVQNQLAEAKHPAKRLPHAHQDSRTPPEERPRILSEQPLATPQDPRPGASLPLRQSREGRGPSQVASQNKQSWERFCPRPTEAPDQSRQVKRYRRTQQQKPQPATPQPSALPDEHLPHWPTLDQHERLGRKEQHDSYSQHQQNQPPYTQSHDPRYHQRPYEQREERRHLDHLEQRRLQRHQERQQNQHLQPRHHPEPTQLKSYHQRSPSYHSPPRYPPRVQEQISPQFQPQYPPQYQHPPPYQEQLPLQQPSPPQLLQQSPPQLSQQPLPLALPEVKQQPPPQTKVEPQMKQVAEEPQQPQRQVKQTQQHQQQYKLHNALDEPRLTQIIEDEDPEYEVIEVDKNTGEIRVVNQDGEEDDEDAEYYALYYDEEEEPEVVYEIEESGAQQDQPIQRVRLRSESKLVFPVGSHVQQPSSSQAQNFEKHQSRPIRQITPKETTKTLVDPMASVSAKRSVSHKSFKSLKRSVTPPHAVVSRKPKAEVTPPQLQEVLLSSSYAISSSKKVSEIGGRVHRSTKSRAARSQERQPEVVAARAPPSQAQDHPRSKGRRSRSPHDQIPIVQDYRAPPRQPGSSKTPMGSVVQSVVARSKTPERSLTVQEQKSAITPAAGRSIYTAQQTTQNFPTSQNHISSKSIFDADRKSQQRSQEAKARAFQRLNPQYEEPEESESNVIKLIRVEENGGHEELKQEEPFQATPSIAEGGHGASKSSQSRMKKTAKVVGKRYDSLGLTDLSLIKKSDEDLETPKVNDSLRIIEELEKIESHLKQRQRHRLQAAHFQPTIPSGDVSEQTGEEDRLPAVGVEPSNVMVNLALESRPAEIHPSTNLATPIAPKASRSPGVPVPPASKDYLQREKVIEFNIKPQPSNRNEPRIPSNERVLPLYISIGNQEPKVIYQQSPAQPPKLASQQPVQQAPTQLPISWAPPTPEGPEHLHLMDQGNLPPATVHGHSLLSQSQNPLQQIGFSSQAQPAQALALPPAEAPATHLHPPQSFEIAHPQARENNIHQPQQTVPLVLQPSPRLPSSATKPPKPAGKSAVRPQTPRVIDRGSIEDTGQDDEANKTAQTAIAVAKQEAFKKQMEAQEQANKLLEQTVKIQTQYIQIQKDILDQRHQNLKLKQQVHNSHQRSAVLEEALKEQARLLTHQQQVQQEEITQQLALLKQKQQEERELEEKKEAEKLAKQTEPRIVKIPPRSRFDRRQRSAASRHQGLTWKRKTRPQSYQSRKSRTLELSEEQEDGSSPSYEPNSPRGIGLPRKKFAVKKRKFPLPLPDAQSDSLEVLAKKKEQKGEDFGAQAGTSRVHQEKAGSNPINASTQVDPAAKDVPQSLVHHVHHQVPAGPFFPGLMPLDKNLQQILSTLPGQGTSAASGLPGLAGLNYPINGLLPGLGLPGGLTGGLGGQPLLQTGMPGPIPGMAGGNSPEGGDSGHPLTSEQLSHLPGQIPASVSMTIPNGAYYQIDSGPVTPKSAGRYPNEIPSAGATPQRLPSASDRLQAVLVNRQQNNIKADERRAQKKDALSRVDTFLKEHQTKINLNTTAVANALSNDPKLNSAKGHSPQDITAKTDYNSGHHMKVPVSQSRPVNSRNSFPPRILDQSLVAGSLISDDNAAFEALNQIKEYQGMLQDYLGDDTSMISSMSLPQQILHSSNAKSRAAGDLSSKNKLIERKFPDPEAKTGSNEAPKAHIQDIDKITDQDSIKEKGSSNSKDKVAESLTLAKEERQESSRPPSLPESHKHELKPKIKSSTTQRIMEATKMENPPLKKEMTLPLQQKDFTERVQSVRSGIRKLEEIAVTNRIPINDILSKKFSSNVSHGGNSKQGEYILKTSRGAADEQHLGESPETIPLPILTAEKTPNRTFRLNPIGGDENSAKSFKDLSRTGSHSATPPLRAPSDNQPGHLSGILKQARIIDDATAIPEHLSQQEASQSIVNQSKIASEQMTDFVIDESQKSKRKMKTTPISPKSKFNFNKDNDLLEEEYGEEKPKFDPESPIQQDLPAATANEQDKSLGASSSHRNHPSVFKLQKVPPLEVGKIEQKHRGLAKGSMRFGQTVAKLSGQDQLPPKIPKSVLQTSQRTKRQEALSSSKKLLPMSGDLESLRPTEQDAVDWVNGAILNIEGQIPSASPSLRPTEQDAIDWVEGVFDNIAPQLSMRTTEQDATAWVMQAVNNVETTMAAAQHSPMMDSDSYFQKHSPSLKDHPLLRDHQNKDLESLFGEEEEDPQGGGMHAVDEGAEFVHSQPPQSEASSSFQGLKRTMKSERKVMIGSKVDSSDYENRESCRISGLNSTYKTRSEDSVRNEALTRQKTIFYAMTPSDVQSSEKKSSEQEPEINSLELWGSGRIQSDEMNELKLALKQRKALKRNLQIADKMKTDQFLDRLKRFLESDNNSSDQLLLNSKNEIEAIVSGKRAQADLDQRMEKLLSESNQPGIKAKKEEAELNYIKTLNVLNDIQLYPVSSSRQWGHGSTPNMFNSLFDKKTSNRISNSSANGPPLKKQSSFKSHDGTGLPPIISLRKSPRGEHYAPDYFRAVEEQPHDEMIQYDGPSKQRLSSLKRKKRKFKKEAAMTWGTGGRRVLVSPENLSPIHSRKNIHEEARQTSLIIQLKKHNLLEDDPAHKRNQQRLQSQSLQIKKTGVEGAKKSLSCSSQNEDKLLRRRGRGEDDRGEDRGEESLEDLRKLKGANEMEKAEEEFMMTTGRKEEPSKGQPDIKPQDQQAREEELKKAQEHHQNLGQEEAETNKASDEVKADDKEGFKFNFKRSLIPQGKQPSSDTE